MQEFEDYPFWDLIAEMAYKPQSETLRKGTYGRFQSLEAGKTLYLFGCNEACRLFIERFAAMYPIGGILDNSEARWGKEFCGLAVRNPREALPEILEEDAAVIIALRLNADAAAEQLEQMGIRRYYGLGVLLSGISPYREMAERLEALERQPVEDMVMLESTNDFDGNAGALYEYLRSRGSSHRFVWVIKNPANRRFLADGRDVAVCPRADRAQMEEYITYRALAKWQIWDNYPIRKVRKDQTNVFLQHFGMGYKLIAGRYRAPEYIDYVLVVNERVYAYEKASLQYPPAAEILFGELPRNDVLLSGPWDELSKITERKYRKVVMWAPTLRESAMFRRIDSDLEYPYGISLLYQEADAEALNEFLVRRDMLLLVKIHPRQKCNYTDNRYSNIRYLDSEAVKKVHAYKLLTQVDAMITDYSSMVFDYMLLDRPVAWVLEDMEHYKVPFLMDNPLDFMPGNHIYTMADLYAFLEQVSEGEDPYRVQRNILSQQYNAPKEGNGCRNVARALGLEEKELI